MSPILATILIVLVIAAAIYLLLLAIASLVEMGEPNYWRAVFRMANGASAILVVVLVGGALIFGGAIYLVNLIAGAVH